MITQTDRLVALAGELERIRADTSRAVAKDGEDVHQVAVDHLVWAHAHLEAARAMRDWARATGDEAAREMAAAAEDDAEMGVRGRSLHDAIAADSRIAAMASRPLPPPDLGAPEEHRLLRATLKDFAEREIRPFAQRVHRDDADIPEDVIAGVGRLGLFGISIPEEYGGSQQSTADPEAMVIATEELSRASLGIGGSLMTRPEILVRTLISGGTEEQKRRWLPGIASGKLLVAVAVTEPDQGSDVAAIKCRARGLPSGEWEITGTKLWCTFAGRAELLMVLCRTSDTGHRGLSIFVMEKPAFHGRDFEHVQTEGGVLRGRAIPTIGYRGMHSFELAFDRYRAPAVALLGADDGLDRGFYLQMEGFAIGRLQTAARAVGVMQAAMDAAFAYTNQRRVFGHRERDLPLVAAKLGRMAARTPAARQLSYRAARLVRDGAGQMEASLAKLYASKMAELVTRESMQLQGGMGYAEESEASRLYVDARVFAIFEGAEEVLSLRVIGRSLLRTS